MLAKMIANSVQFISFLALISSIYASQFGEQFMIEKIQEWKNINENLTVKNTKCRDQLDEWYNVLIKDVVDGNIMQDTWAWRMVDAADKINPGILSGNMIGLGNMDECLAIDEMHGDMEIQGKYCFSGLIIPLGSEQKKHPFHQLNKRINTKDLIAAAEFYSMSICVPHECNWSEILGIDIDLCQTKDTLSEYDGGDWGFIAFMIIIAVLVLLSTCYDWYIRRKESKPAHPITLAFSFYTNSEKLLKISNNPDQLQCLQGIRAMSMLWVLGGHRFNVSLGAPIVNMGHVIEWIQESYSLYVSAAVLAVDSFLFLTGVVMAYGFMKSQSKPNANFNVILYYVHRYIRLTPALAVLYFFYVTIFKHVSTGPVWPIVSMFERGNCLDNSASFFLYIQNIINPDNQCLGQSWYLSVDMQLFLISPLILIPMVKFPKYAGAALVMLILLSVLPSVLITYFKDLLSDSPEFMKHYYTQPYTRISPWLVGLLLGYIFYQFRDRKIKIHWLTNLCMWAVILGGMFYITYVTPDMMASQDITGWAIFNGMHRMFWSVGLMWIAFACQHGYGGIVNWFLTLPMFQVLARLSYSMYLLHVPVQLMAVYRRRSPIFFDDYDMLNQCFGDTITVTFLAFFYCMMFESPVVVIEKVIFAPSGYVMTGMNWCMAKMGLATKSKPDEKATLTS